MSTTLEDLQSAVTRLEDSERRTWKAYTLASTLAEAWHLSREYRDVAVELTDARLALKEYHLAQLEIATTAATEAAITNMNAKVDAALAASLSSVSNTNYTQHHGNVP